MIRDWTKIQQEYEQGTSLRKLALKYGISKTYIIEKRNKENWGRPDTDQLTANPPPKKGDAEREEKQATFLASFRQTANVSESCLAADIDRSTFYEWKEKYEEFGMLYHQAEQIANDRLRFEILRRGVEGWDEPLVSAGKRVGTVRKYSDTLLIFLAKARMEEFREKSKLDVNTNVRAVEIYKIRIPSNQRDDE